VITFVEILIFLSAMFFVGYPVFKKSGVGSRELGVNEALSGLTHKKELVYTAIKDLEFDYRTGKLSEDDYKDLKEKYETEALHILKEIDESGKTISPPLPGGERNEVRGIAIFCPQCGAKIKTGDNFCSKCGAELS
jgi:hypothetical protein